jgi:hypothetical protein
MTTPYLRVAMFTNSLVRVDANFAAAKQVVLYDVRSDGHAFVDVVPFGRKAKKGPGGGKGCVMDDMEDDDGTGVDPLTERVEALDGCSVLFTLGLSDLAAVRVHAKKIFPVKSAHVREIDDVLEQVRALLAAASPPLWVRRVMRAPGGEPMVYEDLQTP